MTRITIISSGEFSGVARALEASAAASGLRLTVAAAAIGAPVPADSVLLLALELEELFPDFYYKLLPMHCSEIEARCNSVIERVSALASPHLAAGGRVVINAFSYPVRLGTSVFDYQNSEGQLAWIERLNAKLVTFAESHLDVYIFGLQHQVYLYGAEKAYSRARALAGRGRYAAPFARRLGAAYARFFSALLRPRRKCLVLDLDNTLWGGVLGEDGPAGIKIGGTGAGCVFQELQREVLQFADQGVLLALNSKNDETAALQVFETHPGMLLKWADFSARRVNWSDKAANLRSIAAELNIGLDSLVFVDDSPYEIALVRRALPEVAAVLLPGPPLSRLKAFTQLPHFDFLKFSEEDMSRRKHYAAEHARGAAKTKFATLEAFYYDLQMRAEISRSDRSAAARIAQLTQKTNQFTLTTRRYSPGEVLRAMEGADSAVYSLRLSDRFGDSGIVGAAVVRTRPEEWEIEAFLLSCRALGRTAENALLSRIQSECARAGAGVLSGVYLPTPRNAPARDFYRDCGFARSGDRWVYINSAGPLPFPAWIAPASRGDGR
jgi:FkbH-like protein